MKSRDLQNMQHFVGGVYQLLLLITGIAIGSDSQTVVQWSDVWFNNILIFIITYKKSIMIGAVFIIFQRMSAELYYRTSIEVTNERLRILYKKIRETLSTDKEFHGDVKKLVYELITSKIDKKS